MPSATILFVDDEPNVLSAIRRTLHDLPDDWEIIFASNGREALDIMAERKVAVIITDIAMPVMDGRDLIVHLYDNFPEVVPLVLSGHWTPAMAHRQVGPSVRFLAKPVSGETLVQAVRDAVVEARLAGLSISVPATPSSLDQATTPAAEDNTWLSLVDGKE